MKPIYLFSFLLTLSLVASSQGNLREKYLKADSLLEANNIYEAYKIYKEIQPQFEKADTLYNYVVWYYIGTASHLQKESMMNEDYTNSLEYGLEALELIRDNQEYFEPEFAEREVVLPPQVRHRTLGLFRIFVELEQQPGFRFGEGLDIADVFQGFLVLLADLFAQPREA